LWQLKGWADPCEAVWAQGAFEVPEVKSDEEEADASDEASTEASGEEQEPDLPEATTEGVGGDNWLRLTADLVRRAKDGRIVAEGHVAFSGQGVTACAAQAHFDPATREITLDGSVQARVESEGRVVRVWASRVVVDTETKAGVAQGVALLGEGIRVSSGRIERKADGTLIAQQVRVTPCLCGQGSRPSWEVTASRMEVGESGRARLNNGMFRIKGVPVLYAPVGWVPFGGGRYSGILPPIVLRPGNDDYEIRWPLYLAPSRWWDATLTPIYNRERGLKVAVGARFARRRASGNFGATFGRDERIIADARDVLGDVDLARQQYGGTRWRSRGQLEVEVVPDVALRVDTDLTSDDRWAFDFETSDTQRARLDYETQAMLHGVGSLASWNVASTYFQDQRMVRLDEAGVRVPYEADRTVSLPARAMVSAPYLPVAGRLGIGADLAYDLALNVSSPDGAFAVGRAVLPGDDPDQPLPRQAHRLLFLPSVVFPVTLFNDGINLAARATGRTEAARTLDGVWASRIVPEVA
jgi:lipopolysaccharide assembly outer membrane protein LptD (OstA)